MSSETKIVEQPFFSSEWCAYAPGKEVWKRDGNFYSAEELWRMDADEGVSVHQPVEKVLIAD